MSFSVSVNLERWPVDGQFIISRGSKSHVDVILCTVSHAGITGRGEATPVYYRGETAEKSAAQISGFCAENPSFDAKHVNEKMPAGAARNALDCALWDYHRQKRGTALWQLIKNPAAPRPLLTAYTLSLADADVMEGKARQAAVHHLLLKLKLAGDGSDRARIAAVHRGAPDARLIVDANESWTGRDVAAEAAAIRPFGVELIEQPVKAGEEKQLVNVNSPIALCADESCHDSGTVADLAPYYDAVNIKLDKAGGLTEAIKLADRAQAAGLKLMVGCMLGTSLAMRPAFALAQRADWVDLDGPLLLARDRPDAMIYRKGYISAE